MGAGHGHHLHFHGHSRLHRLPAHPKLLALVAFVLVVVLTPGDLYPAFAAYAVLLAVAVAASRVPLGYLAPRMLVEAPFVAFAVLIPFVAAGPRVDIGVLSVSQEGLHDAAVLLIKGTLGILASLVMATTTEPRDLLAGLERLRLPQQMVQIMGFMLRYLEVVTDEMRRMRIARESRGFQARSVRAWPALAATAGATFIRSYERGERVHLAMVSRGYTGVLPVTRTTTVTGSQWATAGLLPLLALAVLAVAVLR